MTEKMPGGSSLYKTTAGFELTRTDLKMMKFEPFSSNKSHWQWDSHGTSVTVLYLNPMHKRIKSDWIDHVNVFPCFNKNGPIDRSYIQIHDSGQSFIHNDTVVYRPVVCRAIRKWCWLAQRIFCTRVRMKQLLDVWYESVLVESI